MFLSNVTLVIPIDHIYYSKIFLQTIKFSNSFNKYMMLVMDVDNDVSKKRNIDIEIEKRDRLIKLRFVKYLKLLNDIIKGERKLINKKI